MNTPIAILLNAMDGKTLITYYNLKDILKQKFNIKYPSGFIRRLKKQNIIFEDYNGIIHLHKDYNYLLNQVKFKA